MCREGAFIVLKGRRTAMRDITITMGIA